MIDGDRLVAIDFVWEPEVRSNEDEDFEMVGTLSRMFSRHYAEQTIKDREVVQLRAPLRPGWFTPLVTPGYQCDALPLWRFQLSPSFPDGSRDASD